MTQEAAVETKNQVVETPAKATAKTKKRKRERRVLLVPAQTKRELTTKAKKAVKVATEKELVSTDLEKAAQEGINAVKAIVGDKPGEKLSRFGHMLKAQNGKLDEAILTHGTDFPALCKAVAEGDQVTRRSNVEDNDAMLRRMQDHFLYMSGTGSNAHLLKKRLEKVSLANKVNEINTHLKPAAELFSNYAAQFIS
jgi:hypothetical protein